MAQSYQTKVRSLSVHGFMLTQRLTYVRYCCGSHRCWQATLFRYSPYSIDNLNEHGVYCHSHTNYRFPLNNYVYVPIHPFCPGGRTFSWTMDVRNNFKTWCRQVAGGEIIQISRPGNKFVYLINQETYENGYIISVLYRDCDACNSVVKYLQSFTCSVSSIR